MKRFFCLFLACALLTGLLGGCGKKEEAATGEAEGASGETQEVVEPVRAEDADDPRDADWAGSRTVGLPVRDMLLRETKFAADGSVMGWTDYAYNAAGFLTSETPYAADGSRNVGEYTYRYTYEYVNGWLTAKNAWNSADTLVYRYKYDGSGNEFKWILYDLESGEVRMWYEDSFDDHGSLTTHTLYVPGQEPELMNHREYDYDEYGNPLECRYLSESGTVLSRYGYEYSYDAAGRVTEYRQEDISGSEMVEWYRYEYDENGRMSAQIQYEAGGRVNIRNEYEYDAQGRLYRERIYPASGELAMIVEYTWQ